MSLVKDIKTILSSIPNINPNQIHLSFIPDEDEVVVISQTGGYGFDKADGVEEPTFQIFLRSLDYEIGYTTLYYIRKYLNEVTGVNGIGFRYLAFYETSNIIELGMDNKERYEFTINFRTYRQEI
jgi:hypothetical protein